MWLLILSVLVVHVSSQCKYIRNGNKAYQLDACSYSSLSDTAELSWGIYCQLDTESESYTAVYKQWNAINCPMDTDPAIVNNIKYGCNGIDDDCDCVGMGSENEETCAVATLKVESCDDTEGIYEETKYAFQLCEKSGEKTSKQIVCDKGNSLITMSYENTECEGYGFQINEGNSFSSNNHSEICAQITCTSTAEMLSVFGAFLTVIACILS